MKLKIGKLPLIFSVPLLTFLPLFYFNLLVPFALAYTTNDYQVKSITDLISTGGGRMDWSADGQWIAYDSLGADGYYDVWRIMPDGSGNECLTCDKPGLPNRHQGQPAYHPNGQYLVFQAEKAWHIFDDSHNYSMPGGGLYNDLWLLDLQTGTFYQLNNVSPWTGGSLHPHFSRNGQKLMWGDYQNGEGNLGNWRIAVADFVTSPSPHLENTVYYEPGVQQNWYETHSWLPDDSGIVFSAATLAGQNDYYMDITRMDFSDPTNAIRLTQTSGLNGEFAAWEEMAMLSPAGDIVSYMSSEPYNIVGQTGFYGTWLKTDYWLMNADGSGKKRITYFNEPGYPEYLGNTIVADNSWSPDGKRLAIMVYAKDTNITSIKIIDFHIGLAAYWKLDETSGTTAFDSSNYGRNGTLVNGPTWSGGALNFDGVDDNVRVNAFDLGNTMTFVMWAYINGGRTGIQTLLSNKATSGYPKDGFHFHINSVLTSNQKILFMTGNGSSGAAISSNTGVFTYPGWHHVAAVINRSTGTGSLYMDGQQLTTTGSVRTDFGNNLTLYMGRTGNANPLGGTLDDVRIYSRELSASEILGIYNGN